MSEEQELRERLKRLEDRRTSYRQTAEECAAERLVLESRATAMNAAIADGDEKSIDRYMELYQKIRRLQVREDAARRCAAPSVEETNIRRELRQIKAERETAQHRAVMERFKPETEAANACADIISPSITAQTSHSYMNTEERRVFLEDLRERAFLNAKREVHRMHHEEGTILLEDQDIRQIVERELGRYRVLDPQIQV